MSQEEQADIGKRWIRNAFERISKEFKDSVTLEHWAVKDDHLAYRLSFQVAGKADVDFITFTRATIDDCGSSNPANDPVRREVEARIRNRFLSLVQ